MVLQIVFNPELLDILLNNYLKISFNPTFGKFNSISLILLSAFNCWVMFVNLVKHFYNINRLSRSPYIVPSAILQSQI
jgi:hypothetical protein